MLSFATVLPILALIGGAAASPIDFGGKKYDDNLCIISDIRYTNPWYTRHQYRKGNMKCPDGIDSFLFIALLDKCCDDYERHHPGHHWCEDDSCDDDDDEDCDDDECDWHKGGHKGGHGGECGEGGCHGGNGWNDHDGICLIADLKIRDPIWTRKQYKKGNYKCPEGLDIGLFISTLDKCCEDYEREHRGHHGHGWKGEDDDEECDGEDSDCDDDDEYDDDDEEDCDGSDDEDDCDDDDDEDCDDEDCDEDEGGFFGLNDLL